MPHYCITPAVHYSSNCAQSRALLDRCADLVPPLGPRTVVVPNVSEAEQIREDKPGVARALADPTINDRVHIGFHPGAFEIDFSQFFGGFEGVVILGCG